VNRSEKENLTIRWKTFVPGSNQTGDLYISYDAGARWLLLQPSVRLTDNKFQWQIKDTNSRAVLKMETSFGDFLSTHFIIGNITRLKLDFNCADSFRLSWNKHIYANGYRIFALTDSPYLEPIFTTADTFTVLQKAISPFTVYAVEPLLSNNIPAARSAALDIRLQGVQCFYKSFYYNVLDNNRLNLLLEISVATYADSVFFEKVTATGMLLQTYGGTKVNDPDLTYTTVIDEVPAGVTYLRARIKLKTGAIVYTEIVSVLTSGKRIIWFYPNPVSRNVPLKHVLLQGVSTSTQLQLYDAIGRLLRTYSSLPDNIDLSGFPAGVIFYKLLDTGNHTIETGKLLIN
jgi:hypothetical protein